MARSNRGAAATSAADAPDDAADAPDDAAANAPAADGAGAPSGPSAVQIAAAALSELRSPQFVAFMDEKGQMGLPSDTVLFLVK